jgi:hypothetical protein
MSIITTLVFKFETEFYNVKIDTDRSKCFLEYKHSFKTKYIKAKTKYEINYTKLWIGTLNSGVSNVSTDSPKFLFDKNAKYETLLMQVEPNKYIHVYNMINEFETDDSIVYFNTIKSNSFGILNFAETKHYTVLMFNISKNFSYVNINNSYKKSSSNPFEALNDLDIDKIPNDAIIPHNNY